MKPLYFATAALILLTVFSCRETEDFTSDPSAVLTFSTDTVHFDTVFTTIGSSTLQFRFYNPNSKAVKTTISLAGGSNSYYRLNIDGQPATEIKNYEILANDSAYVFVEVNVDPQNSNSPMVIDDSVMFYTNGNQQNVKLVAYGQDVHLYNGEYIETPTWVADKPYLIYNSVAIKEDATLTIEAGADIYFHNESAMWVYGTLNVMGTTDARVTFQGDRLEEWYENAPGQWYGYIRNENGNYPVGGLFFSPSSKNNIIDYAIIRNGAIGIQLYDTMPNNNLKLTLSNTILKNMSAVGLYTQFSNTLVYNTVIANCGFYAVLLTLGGNHEFYHSTIGNYYEFDSRKTESLIFTNYYKDEDEIKAFDFNAIFGNCIIYGDQEIEFYADFDVSTGVQVSFLFDHCLMKLDEDFDTSNEDIYKNIIRHKNSLPKFVNTYEGNFRLDTLSAAKDKGSTYYSSFYPLDQDNIDRTLDGKPDLGAYERVEGE